MHRRKEMYHSTASIPISVGKYGAFFSLSLFSLLPVMRKAPSYIFISKNIFFFCGEGESKMSETEKSLVVNTAVPEGSPTTKDDKVSPSSPLPEFSNSISSSSPPPTGQNGGFDLFTKPIERQFSHIESEFTAIEGKTMDTRRYNFTTSLSLPTKNRYINVMANEETIFPPVKLRSSSPTEKFATSALSKLLPQKLRPGSPSPLYINGNLIQLPDCPQPFVACQAPTPDCISDFLQTIYQYGIDLILMLTELEENAMVKADRYWPMDSVKATDGEIFGSTRVWKDPEDPYTLDEVHELIRRPFFIQPCKPSTDKSRRGPLSQPNSSAEDPPPHKVVLIQYTGWPDHGVPDSTASFEKLLSIINNHTNDHKKCPNGVVSAAPLSSPEEVGKPKSSSLVSPMQATTQPQVPIIVHCSAGIGRTGTLIGAYAATTAVSRGQLTNRTIADTLTAMRLARFGMVQRVEQYMFLYMIVMRHLDVDVSGFAALLQRRADAYNFRIMEARRLAMAARGRK